METGQWEDAQHTIIEPFKLKEVEKQMKKMQNNKACCPDGVPTESLRLVYKIDPMLICDQMNAALEKGIQQSGGRAFWPPCIREGAMWQNATTTGE